MKRLAWIAMVVLALVVGSAITTASAHPGHATAAKAKKKKCKKGHSFRKGKCRRVLTPPPPIPRPTTRPPNSIVRASLTLDGPASVWMQVKGQQGRAGFFPGEGLLNEIPSAHCSCGGSRDSGPRTDTFTDDLFYGGYGFINYPNPGNRGFGFTFCENGASGPDPVRVDYMWVEADGLVDHGGFTLTPGDLVHGCVGY
jgi:hypothetical protein